MNIVMLEYLAECYTCGFFNVASMKLYLSYG